MILFLIKKVKFSCKTNVNKRLLTNSIILERQTRQIFKNPLGFVL